MYKSTFELFLYDQKKKGSWHQRLRVAILDPSPSKILICKNCDFIMYGSSEVWLLVLILICAILDQSINDEMVG